MRCVHCGKEVGDKVVFCIGCGRPVKREYEKYSCEIYNDFSIKDKMLNCIDGVREKDKYKTKAKAKPIKYSSSNTIDKKLASPSQKIGEATEKLKDKLLETKDWIGTKLSEENNTSDTNHRSFNDGEYSQDFQKSNTIEYSDDDYEDIGYSNPCDSEADTNADINIDADYQDCGYDDPEYLDLKDIPGAIKKSVKSFKESSEDEKAATLKILFSVLAFCFVLFSSCIDSSNDSSYTYYEYNENEYEEYEFPTNPVFDEYTFDDMEISNNSCEIDADFIVDYLVLINEDISMLESYSAPLHKLEDYEKYNIIFEKYISDVAFEERPYQLDEIINLYESWNKTIKPILEDKEQFTEDEIYEKVDSFKYEFNEIAEYYLEEEY